MRPQKTIKDLLVMQQVQVSIVNLVRFKLRFQYLTFSLCFCPIEPPNHDYLLGQHKGVISRAKEGQKESGQLGVQAKQGQARASYHGSVEDKFGCY